MANWSKLISKGKVKDKRHQKPFSLGQPSLAVPKAQVKNALKSFKNLLRPKSYRNK